jgi:site-specific DNA recombinase
MAMRVALYTRVSTQHQAQAQTVEQQIERLVNEAHQQGWEVPLDQIFRDDGYSGASLRRPGLDRLRDRAAACALDLILITAPDRLARNYVHQVLLLDELQRYGCEVRFLDRPMSQDPHDQLLLQIRGAVAEYERSLITERMRRGRQRKLEAGIMLPWTRAPFGYRVDPAHPRDPAGVRVEPAEAAIVREIFAWYAEEAHSFYSLAQMLEQRGIRTSTGLARWNLASLRALLRNPAYTGRVYGNRWHRRGTVERRSAMAPGKRSAMSLMEAPREAWILVAEIPPLVSQEQFDRVQARLVSNQRFAQRNNKAHPYAWSAAASAAWRVWPGPRSTGIATIPAPASCPPCFPIASRSAHRGWRRPSGWMPWFGLICASFWSIPSRFLKLWSGRMADTGCRRNGRHAGKGCGVARRAWRSNSSA